MRLKFFFAGMIGLASTGSIAQNVGIGNSNPRYPLSFGTNIGQKITLWDNGDVSGANYGLGIQSGLLQIHSYSGADDIAFGFGSSSNFTERMRVKGNGFVGIGASNPQFLLDVAGRIRLRSSGFPNSAGLWLNDFANSGTPAFIGMYDDNTVGFYGTAVGWSLLMNTNNGRVGIGNASPNAPLSFPPSLGKKITLYPGATGDVGFGVSGNRLQIYSDNPNADVALGYDAAGTFNERFAVKPNGALALVGNTGNPGQVLQSNGGGGAATWTNKPTATYFNQSSTIALLNTDLCVDIPGVNGQVLTLTQASVVTYQYTIPLYADNGAFGGDSKGAISIQLLDGASNIVSAGTSEFRIGNYVTSNVVVIGIGVLGPGSYSVRARVVRNGTADGNTRSNAGQVGTVAGCNDVSIPRGQMVIQIFPQ